MRDSHTVITGGTMLFGHPKTREALQSILAIPDKGYVHTARKKHPHHVQTLDTSRLDEEYSARLNLALMNAWPSFLVLQTADQIQKFLPGQTDPDFQFLRHVRNAIAHDGVFDIRNLKRPARFDGYEIVEDLHGTPLFDFLLPGDLLALLDHIEARLRRDFA